MTLRIDYKKLNKKLNAWIHKVAEDYMGIMNREVSKNHEDTGELRKSHHVRDFPNQFRSSMESWVRQSVIKEFGRKPWKSPPYDALVWWVIRKRWYTWSTSGSYEVQPFQTKRAIRNLARSIARNGIKPLHIYTSWIEKNTSKLLSSFNRWFQIW